MREERFRRLLRWYPRWWRDRYGAALVGTMLDDAERRGRSAPSAGERFSAAAHGLGFQLDRRTAFGAALAALGVAAAGGAIMVWAVYPLASAGAGWVTPVLVTGIAPGLVAVSGVAWARLRGLLSEPRAVVVAILALLAVGGAALAQVSLASGLEAADAGAVPTGLATVWIWLVGAAWASGAGAIAVVGEALVGRTPLPRPVGVVLVVVVSLVLAPAIGIGLTSPVFALLGGAGFALLSGAREATSRRSPGPVGPAGARTRDIVRTAHVARLLSATTTVLSGLAVVYALTGSRWPGAGDATTAMGQGIAAGVLASLPLLAAIGLLVTARGRTRPVHTWVPLVLVGMSMVAVAVAYQGAPAWNDMVIGFAAGSALGGAAIAWWAVPRLPGPIRTRIAVALLIGLGYAAFLGILIAPLAAFALPLLATGFAIWAPRTLSARPGASGSGTSPGPLATGAG